jgi:antitoxin MazE
MKTRLVRIGNSQGVRIPKLLIEQSGLRGDLEMEAGRGVLVIRTACKPRAGWDEAFRTMAECGDDAILADMPACESTWDENRWEWR